MTRQRRNNLDIIAEILRVAKDGANKTRIVYRANLNFKVLHEYLDELQEAGLIATDKERNGTLTTTEMGVEYLKHYSGFRQFVKNVAQ